MKISKTILKNIIREALESGDFDSIIGEEEQETASSVQKLTNTFIEKIKRIAPTELAQIDDVVEVINVVAEMLNLIGEENPTDFTFAEDKRVGIELKKMAMDMQNKRSDDPEPGVPA